MAITEAAAILGGALAIGKPVVETGCKLIEDLLGEPCKVAGAMISDQLYVWQWRNRIQIANRANEILQEDGISRQVLPTGFLMPLLEGAGNTDAPSLQEMFAQLLASGVSAQENQHPAFVRIIGQLSTDEANLLHHLSQAEIRLVEYRLVEPIDNPLHSVASSDYPVAELRANKRLSMYLAHLESLGVVHYWQDAHCDLDEFAELQGCRKCGSVAKLSDFGQYFGHATSLGTSHSS